MDPSEMEAGTTAVAYTDLFVDAALKKLDSTFGKGFTHDHPAVLAAYLAASSQNMHSFMLAATAMQGSEIEEALAAYEAEMLPPAPKPKSKRGR